MGRRRIWLGIWAFCMALLFSMPSRGLNRYLKVGFNQNLPPFQFIDGDGQFAGVHVEMLEAIGENRGYSFTFVPFDTNRACLEALSAGQVDLAMGIIPDSLPKDSGFVCADVLTSSQLCMVVRNDVLEQNLPITTAVYASDTIQHTLLANLGIHQFIAAGNQRMVYARHLSDPSTAMIGVKDSLLYQLIQDGAEDAYTVRYNYLDTIDFGLLVRRGDGELLRAMNESVSQFKASPAYESLCNRWLPNSDQKARLDRAIRQITTGSVIVAALVLGYSIIMRRIQQMLKRQVAQQTQEIQRASQELEKQFAQLQDENDLRNRIIKYSPSGMLLFDLDYNVVLMNKSACGIAGQAESWVGRSAREVPVFREILEKEGPSVFVPGMTVENGILRLGDSPGQMRVYSYLLYQVNQYGRVAGVLLSVSDMTKAERMQQAEFDKQKSQALTRIAAGIAHEIRNPLMSIGTFATLVGTRGEDKQVQESFAKYVPGEVDRINRLIESLIHYAKPAKRQTERVDLNQLLEDSLALVRPVLRKTGFLLAAHLQPEAYILADRDQIRQVLTNILINGIQAMEQKSAAQQPAQPLTLTVELTQEGEKWRLRIRDEGIGMTEAELQACRDPFFTTKEAGTGLGLTLCEQYIKENNGAMEMDSVKGQYTQITLLFERS